MRREFYQSKAWKNVRRAYAISKNCICERCGRPVYVDGVTDYIDKEKRIRSIVHHKTYLDDSNIVDDSIALDESNLELLCIDCHNTEHHNRSTRKGLRFDEQGNLIEVKNIRAKKG